MGTIGNPFGSDEPTTEVAPPPPINPDFDGIAPPVVTTPDEAGVVIEVPAPVDPVIEAPADIEALEDAAVDAAQDALDAAKAVDAADDAKPVGKVVSRPRGWLEAAVKQFLENPPADVALTPHAIGKALVAQEGLEAAPSTGAVAAVLDRWNTVGAVELADSPRRFIAFTPEAQAQGIDGLKAAHKAELKAAKDAARAAAKAAAAATPAT